MIEYRDINRVHTPNRSNMHSFVSGGANQATYVWRRAASQPGWVSRFAGLTFLLILAVPIILLVGFAIAAAIVVFGVLAGINVLMNWVRGILPKGDDRKNVRVIHRDSSS